MLQRPSVGHDFLRRRHGGARLGRGTRVGASGGTTSGIGAGRSALRTPCSEVEFTASASCSTFENKGHLYLFKQRHNPKDT